MNEQALLTNMIYTEITGEAVSQFRKEYTAYQKLFQIQPLWIQHTLEIEAAKTAELVLQGSRQLRFYLPDQVVVDKPGIKLGPITTPPASREQVIGGLMGRIVHTDLCTALCSRFLELEHSKNLAESTGAVLLRHTLAMHMVHSMLPSGKNVQYMALNGDEIPSIPIPDQSNHGTELRVVGISQSAVDGRGDTSAPYVEAARRFYIPQWVPFDENGRLLTSSASEAEAQIASMQHYYSIIRTAVILAPYIVADEEYQNKRYGILGQLVNQGRALASFRVREIIQTIRQRVAIHDLDRGLSLSIPYFNDQTLTMEAYSFDVIPSGRVMFISAFIVLAVRAQAAKVAQDTRLSQSTRRQLLTELSILEETFSR